MLMLREQAEAILEKLRDIPGLNFVDLTEEIDGEARRPVVYPAAQLVLSAEPTSFDQRSISAKTSWTVLVMAKTIVGEHGLMAMVDAVLDALSGFQPVVGTALLAPTKVEFIDKSSGIAAYAVTMATRQNAGWVAGAKI